MKDLQANSKKLQVFTLYHCCDSNSRHLAQEYITQNMSFLSIYLMLFAWIFTPKIHADHGYTHSYSHSYTPSTVIESHFRRSQSASPSIFTLKLPKPLQFGLVNNHTKTPITYHPSYISFPTTKCNTFQLRYLLFLMVNVCQTMHR